MYESAPIAYSKSSADTRLTRLQAQVESDAFLHLEGLERLAQVLDWLEVPQESQVLVFSKTSEQNTHISPSRPRAIYFSDNVYVGYVQGGDIEVITFDPKLGIVFHRIENNKGTPAKIKRDASCLRCHGGGGKSGYPELLVRSVSTQNTGLPLFSESTYFTDHSSPITERWGGWYVIGASDGQLHMGNQFAALDDGVVDYSDLNPTDWIQEQDYLHGASSDIVALMVLEHQVTVHNALNKGNLITQVTLERHRNMRTAFGEPLDAPLNEVDQGIIAGQAHAIVEALLFSHEFKMEDAGVAGSESFEEAFRKGTPEVEGRSLKDLRLYGHLFKHRCSYLIYSEAFMNLPPLMKTEVTRLLRAVLSQELDLPEFSHLKSSECQKILTILESTMTGWD